MADRRPSLRDLDRIEVPDLWPAIVERSERAGNGKIGTSLGMRRLRPALGLAVAGALVMAIAAVLIGVPFTSGPSAIAILDAARLRFADMKPFDAEIIATMDRDVILAERPDYGGGDDIVRRRLRWQDPQTWRRDTLEETVPPVIDGGAGSFMVRDGSEWGNFRADEAQFTRNALVPGVDPLGELGWATVSRTACAEGGQVVGEEPVAGRSATRIVCRDREVWVDRATGLVLRHVADGYTSEFVSLSLDPTFGPELFQVEVPEEAQPAPTIAPGSRLLAGELPPSWEGRTLDGQGWSMDDVVGERTAIYIWADWCDRACLDDLPAIEALAAPRTEGLRVITIAAASDPSRTSEVIAAEHVDALPVLIDDGSILEAWGLAAVPTLVVLDEGGAVQQVALGRDVDHLIDALREER